MREKTLTYSLILVFFLYLIFTRFSQINFNYFHIPQESHIYLYQYPKEYDRFLNFTVFSTRETICTVTCGNSSFIIELNKELNKISLHSCSENSSKVKINCSNLFLTFTSIKVAHECRNRVENITNISLKRDGRIIYLHFNVLYNFSCSEYLPVKITFGNKEITPLYFFDSKNNTITVFEKIVPEGCKEVTVSVENVSASQLLPLERNYSENLFLSFVIIFSIIIIFFLTDKYSPLLRFLIISFSVFLILSLDFQVKSLSNSLFPRILSWLLLLTILTEIFGRIKLSISTSIEKEALIVSLFFLAYVFSLKFFIGEFDAWWPYYLRNTDNTFLHGTVFFFDDLSYLGRNFAYPPAFFDFGANLTNLLVQERFIYLSTLLHYFIVFLYAATTYLLFVNFRSFKERLVGFLILTSLNFTLLTCISGTLHTFSWFLLHLSVLFFILSKKSKLISSLPLSLSFSVHPLNLFVFPVYAYSFNNFKLEKRLVKNIFLISLISATLSLPFYLPIFVKYGFPNEVVPQKWGYLIKFGIDGLINDYQFLFVLIFFTFFASIWKKELRVPLLILFLLLLANYKISYRINVFIPPLLSTLFLASSRDLLKRNTFFTIVFATLLLNFVLSIVIYSGTTDWCIWGSINNMCKVPFTEMGRIYSYKEKVALNPEYGHLFTYFAGRKVLADLYVEYADPEKFYAEDDFYSTLNVSYLEPYKISLAILDRKGDVDRNLPSFERIFDSGYFHVFRIRIA